MSSIRRISVIAAVISGTALGCTGTMDDLDEVPVQPPRGVEGGTELGEGNGPVWGSSDGTHSGDGEPLPADDVPVDFFLDIQPILGDNCVRCHGGVRELPQAPGRLSLNLQSRSTAERVLGEAGKLDKSILFMRITHEDPSVRMPFGGQPLPPETVNKLRRWLFQGAPWPQHWAFAPINPPDPKAVAVSDETWPRTPIDRFILNHLDREKVVPSPVADPTTLLRRISLDLTGLPPTLEEVDAFAADPSATAYEAVVDKLLGSPAFGERWGRHWMDLARYSDSEGYEKDRVRTRAWRWRDWVIDAFNEDEPFDQFTIEQIAGDLIPGATPLQVAATGFHRNTVVNREDGSDPEEDRTKRIIDRAATVAETWLGLTMGCTQCHSHPYDNLKQEEFYQLVSFFNNADDASSYERADLPGASIRIEVPATSDEQSTDLVEADVLQERTSDRRKTYLLSRGDFMRPDKGKELKGDTPAVLPPLMPRGARADRLDLAKWLVRSDNPLTPRVTVNTIWYHLFGRGIVSTLDDFGARSQYPSHPELLDWLAADFVGGGWKRKRLIKEIIMSAVYRQSSVVRPDVAMMDPENVLLSRQNRLRVTAEIVSDVNLAASGLLDTKMGGPCVFPPLPEEFRDLVKGAYGDFVWTDSEGGDRYRRSVYTLHKRLALYPNLSVFDWPNAAASTTGRLRTNTPLQALATLHGTVFVEAAQALARRVQAEAPGALKDQLVLGMRLATGRTPTGLEVDELEKLFMDERALYAADTDGAAKAVGSFAPPDVPAPDAAAWVMTASTILNLDEVINRE
jgi:hypothetical protein